MTGPDVRVLLVDDQDLVRTGFRVILSSEPGFAVVGEAGDGARAVELAAQLRPDVVLMDIQMPVLDGLAATARITGGSDAKVIVLTTFDDDDAVFDSLRAGASGFLLKTARAEHLIEAVRTVADGESLLAPAVTARVIARATQDRAGRTVEPDPRLAELTSRELEVLQLMGRGRSNAEIATELFLSGTTVKTHVSRVLTKLQLRDRTAAVVFAYENGVVVPGSA